MRTESPSPNPAPAWPFDLRVFAIMSGLWALCLVLSATVNLGEFTVVDPIVTTLAGVRFKGDDARIVLLVQAGIFAAIAYGVFWHRRWGLLLALCYMVQVVMSHLAFVIAYMPIASEWRNVRAAASQGPTMVLITLYLWIRACDLIFDLPAPPDARSRPESDVRRPAAVSEDPGASEIAAIAGGGQ
ncbi:MAG: hypothetical protein WBY93_10360 [Candidatus Binatus sp.]